MKALFDILSNILNRTVPIVTKKLPTQGIFYPKDFQIKIKKAKIEDIVEYEYLFKPDNILEIIEIIKNFVKKNVEFSKGYCFEDLKSIDIVFIFLEIVKFTNNRPVKISYLEHGTNRKVDLDFDPIFFNYFDFSPFVKSHNQSDGYIEIEGWRFSMPSIGVENCVTSFLLSKIDDDNSSFYNEQSYDFMFFLGNRNHLSNDEIDNLIHIFNVDLEDSDKILIKSIIAKFQKLIGYTIKVDNKIIDLKSNLNLANIWKE